MAEEKIENAVVLDSMHNYTQVLLEWKTPEFVPTERSKSWFTVAGIIVLSLVIYAIYSNSATMAVVFLLLAGMFFLTHRQKPRLLTVKITDLGIEYDNKFYSYHQINAFWMVYHPPYVRSLYLRLGGKTYKYLKIELNYQNPIELRKLLLKELPEIEGAGELMTDILARILRLQ